MVIVLKNSGGGGSSNYKGWFADEAALIAAFPTGEDGRYAAVGSTDTFWIWDGDTSTWVDSGEKPITDHNSLNGLQGGNTTERYHLTQAQVTNLNNQSGENTGDQDISGIGINAGNIATNASDIDNLEDAQVWAKNGDDINNINTGNVGIGTNSPTTALQINQHEDANGIKLVGFDDMISYSCTIGINGYGNTNMMATGSITYDGSYIHFGQNNASVIKFGSSYRAVNIPTQFYGYNATTGNKNYISFLLDNDGVYKLTRSNTETERFDIDIPTSFVAGSVGIGTTTPSEKLEVNGGIKAGGNVAGQSNMKSGLNINSDRLNDTIGDFVVNTFGKLKALVVSAVSSTLEIIIPTKIGDVAGGNYTKFESDGTMEAVGDATTWDDLRVSPNSLPGLGADAPEHVVVANDGSATVGYALEFDGSDDYGKVADYAALDTTDLSINFWINTATTNTDEFISRDGQIRIWQRSNKIYVRIGNSRKNTDSVLISGSTQMITVTNTDNGDGTSTSNVYVNSTLVDTLEHSSTLSASSNDLFIARQYDGTNDYKGVMDALYGFNIILTQSQIDELYNDGAGSTAIPAGITEATDVMFKFDFTENTGTTTDNNCTLGAGHDMTLYGGVTWVDGLMGVTSGSFGVTALSFPADKTTQIFFTAQLPHTYKQGTDIEPHVHRNHKTSNTGNVLRGLEYIWVNVGDSGGNTTIIENAMSVGTPGQHKATNIAILDGTGKTISSILTCRLYRKGGDALDTYPDEVLLSEFDFHFEINTLGSRGVRIK